MKEIRRISKMKKMAVSRGKEKTAGIRNYYSLFRLYSALGDFAAILRIIFGFNGI